MNAVTVIALWGVLALGCAIIAGVVAAAKNRDHSWWAAWCFVLPPILVLLLVLPANKAAPRKRRSLDDGDNEREGEWI